METTIKINTDALTPEIIEGIKKLFPHKLVEITIQPANETEYSLSNPALPQVLPETIAEYETKKYLQTELDEIKNGDARFLSVNDAEQQLERLIKKHETSQENEAHTVE
jgi:uncharacterized protein YdcH (DUF465 family)